MSDDEHDRDEALHGAIRRLEELVAFGDHGNDRRDEQLAELAKSLVACERRIRQLELRIEQLFVQMASRGEAGEDAGEPEEF